MHTPTSMQGQSYGPHKKSDCYHSYHKHCAGDCRQISIDAIVKAWYTLVTTLVLAQSLQGCHVGRCTDHQGTWQQLAEYKGNITTRHCRTTSRAHDSSECCPSHPGNTTNHRGVLLTLCPPRCPMFNAVPRQASLICTGQGSLVEAWQPPHRQEVDVLYCCQLSHATCQPVQYSSSQC